MQWCVRPAEVSYEDPLGPELPVRKDRFTVEEVTATLKKMRSGKASGPDDIPVEYYKVLTKCPAALDMLTDFLNLCWESKGVPAKWHEAFVPAIYKKGAIDQCENYRPISLLNIGYKTFAALMLARLVEVGAEERLSSAQFGFRSKCSTVDAVFVLLRRLDAAIAQRNGKLVVLALDWIPLTQVL